MYEYIGRQVDLDYAYTKPIMTPALAIDLLHIGYTGNETLFIAT